jgi:hypothetical protein
MWQTTADPRAIAEAQTWTFHYRAPIEPWLEEAVVQLAVQALSAEQIKKHRENMQHFERGSYVWDLHKGGLTWAQAKAATVAAIERSGRYVTAGTVWESYKKVLKDLRRGRNSVYRYFNDIRYRHLG